MQAAAPGGLTLEFNVDRNAIAANITDRITEEAQVRTSISRLASPSMDLLQLVQHTIRTSRDAPLEEINMTGACSVLSPCRSS